MSMTINALNHPAFSIGADFSLIDGPWLNRVRVGELTTRVVILGGARIGRRTKHLAKLHTRHTKFTRECIAATDAFRMHMNHMFYLGKHRVNYYQEVPVTSEVEGGYRKGRGIMYISLLHEFTTCQFPIHMCI